MIEPYYEQDGITIYHGDCRDILPQFPDKSFDLVLTDPPYGIGYDPERYKSMGALFNGKIVGDDADFDPSFLMKMSAVKVLWGANNFSSRLPGGGWLVWDKRCSEEADKMKGSPFELAWTSVRDKFKILRLQHGGAKNADARNGDAANESRCHPTQKPIRLMTWCISLFHPAQFILDPYMGSAPVLIAAKQLGRKAVGIEIEEKYCEIAVKRLAQMELKFSLSGEKGRKE